MKAIIIILHIIFLPITYPIYLMSCWYNNIKQRRKTKRWSVDAEDLGKATLVPESKPRIETEIKGVVAKKIIGKGSKSERIATILKTNNMDLALRMKDGLAFGDTTFDHLIGKSISCRGYRHHYTFIVESWEEE